LIAGTNITLTGTADNITIASSGGGVSDLDGLTDVVISNPQSFEVMRRNLLNNTWENGKAVFSACADVDLTGLSNNDILRYDGTAGRWKRITLNAGSGISIIHNPNEILISSAGGGGIPVGTSGERPIGTIGAIRYNTTLSSIEIYNGIVWRSIEFLGSNIYIVQNGQVASQITTGTFSYLNAWNCTVFHKNLVMASDNNYDGDWSQGMLGFGFSQSNPTISPDSRNTANRLCYWSTSLGRVSPITWPGGLGSRPLLVNMFFPSGTKLTGCKLYAFNSPLNSRGAGMKIFGSTFPNNFDPSTPGNSNNYFTNPVYQTILLWEQETLLWNVNTPDSGFIDPIYCINFPIQTAISSVHILFHTNQGEIGGNVANCYLPGIIFEQ
jgi:hypothetical protein